MFRYTVQELMDLIKRHKLVSEKAIAPIVLSAMITSNLNFRRTMEDAVASLEANRLSELENT